MLDSAISPIEMAAIVSVLILFMLSYLGLEAGPSGLAELPRTTESSWARRPRCDACDRGALGVWHPDGAIECQRRAWFTSDLARASDRRGSRIDAAYRPIAGIRDSQRTAIPGWALGALPTGIPGLTVRAFRPKW